MIRMLVKWPGLALALYLAGCSLPPIARVTPPAKAPPVPTFTASDWNALPDWQQTDLSLSLAAFNQSCRTLQKRAEWQDSCNEAASLDPNDNDLLRQFFESRFTPYRMRNPDGSDTGLITGYYEPKLAGSRVKTKRFRYPLYAVPDDMLTIDLASLYPQLKGLRLRGRVEGKKVVPYYDRAAIDGKHAPKGKELFWVDNAVDLFFLQVQGSGRIELPDGTLVKVGFADQNGHPYASIGRKLIAMGEMKLENASLQGIKAWAEANPDKLQSLLESNPSYVFFRELPSALPAAIGAMGLPLTSEYSIAVDPSVIPLGAPVFLATTMPNTETPLNRLMLAQDTGGAIKGTIRADFFWGFGDEAGAQAGRMKQQGRMWLLLPKGMQPPATKPAR